VRLLEPPPRAPLPLLELELELELVLVVELVVAVEVSAPRRELLVPRPREPPRAPRDEVVVVVVVVVTPLCWWWSLDDGAEEAAGGGAGSGSVAGCERLGFLAGEEEEEAADELMKGDACIERPTPGAAATEGALINDASEREGEMR